MRRVGEASSSCIGERGEHRLDAPSRRGGALSLVRPPLNPIISFAQDPTTADAAARAYASRCAVTPALAASAAAAWRPVAAALAANLAARPPPGAGGVDVAAALARLVEVCPHVHR